MKSGAVISIVLLGVFGGALAGPALAQNALGGPKKQTAVGGPAPVKQNMLGGPAPANTYVVVKPKIGTMSASPTPPVTTAVVPPPPGPAAGSPPPATKGAPTSVVKCAVKGACVGPTKQPTEPSPHPKKGT
jgi:hypothetical protein